VDQWLWSVRMTKTRSDAAAACRGGHVKVNGKAAKPATPVKVGDRVEAYLHDRERILEVTRLIVKRVGAGVACRVFRRPQPATAGTRTRRGGVPARSRDRPADQA
jgi:ribosome-associated heat shock protein Hsp15